MVNFKSRPATSTKAKSGKYSKSRKSSKSKRWSNDNIPTMDYFSECFSFDFESGELVWVQRPLWHFEDVGVSDRSAKAAWRYFNRFHAGNIAGSTASKTKRSIISFTYEGESVRIPVECVLYYMWYGEIPAYVEHKNGDHSDNSIHNLIGFDSKAKSDKFKAGMKVGNKAAKELAGTKATPRHDYLCDVATHASNRDLSKTKASAGKSYGKSSSKTSSKSPNKPTPVEKALSKCVSDDKYPDGDFFDKLYYAVHIDDLWKHVLPNTTFCKANSIEDDCGLIDAMYADGDQKYDYYKHVRDVFTKHDSLHPSGFVLLNKARPVDMFADKEKVDVRDGTTYVVTAEEQARNSAYSMAHRMSGREASGFVSVSYVGNEYSTHKIITMLLNVYKQRGNVR